MPDGRVQRIDEKKETVYIVRRGHTYAAPLGEVETKARVPSARVSFELVRRNGTESAANVRLRSGTRTNRRHRRFGDLSGARRPGAKVDTVAKHTYGIDVTTQPFRVAGAWLEAMEDQDFDGATSLYLPEATLHTENGSMDGRRRIRAELERCTTVGVDAAGAEIRGIDRYVRIDCRAGDEDHATYLVIDRGAIVEQWIDVEPQQATDEADEAAILIVCRGDVPDQVKQYADDKIAHVIHHTGKPARFARVKLMKAENPAVERPAMAEATIEFEKSLVRAHGNAATFTEAVDLVAGRLASRIEHQRGRENRKPTGLEAPPGTWQHGNLGRSTAPYFDRPEDEREIVRHKSLAADEMTIDEAAWDMAMLDYDFFLFVEATTGSDALLERADHEALVLHRVEGGEVDDPTTVADVSAIDTPVPKLAVSEALDLLNASGGNLQFFSNRITGRGNVVYRRFDGHYGLVTPPLDEDG